MSGIDLVPVDTAQLNLHGGACQTLEGRWQTDHRNLRKMTSPERKKKNLRNYKIQKSCTLVFQTVSDILISVMVISFSTKEM